MAQRKRYVKIGADQIIAGTGNDVFTYEYYDTTPAFLEGDVGSTSSQGAYLTGEDSTDDSQSAYLSGTVSYIRQVAYQVVDTTPENVDDTSNVLVVATLDTPASKVPAWLEGELGGTPVSDSQSAYLTGPIPASSDVSAYLFGQVEVTSSQSAFMVGQITDSLSAFTEGVERSNVSAFVRGAIGQYQKTLKLTIDYTEVAEAATDFPVYVKLWGATDTQSELATVANGGYVQNTTTGGASGSVTVPADLVIAADKFNEDVYDFEIEYWDPTTGELHAWFRMPSLSDTVDTDYYINFGDAGTIISQEHVAGVWIDDYIAVYHLHEASGTRYDSTGNNHHGTPVGSPGTYANNTLYEGLDADGAEYIEVPWHSDFEIEDEFCLESWVKSDISSYSPPGRVIDIGGYDTGLGIWASGSYMYGYYNEEFQSSDISISTGAYYIYGLKYDGTTVRFIRDYTTRSSDVVSPGTIVHNPIRIGAACDAVEEYFDGWIDEVRISNVDRSDEYFETNHRMIWRYYQSQQWLKTIGTVEDVIQRSSQDAWLEGYTAGKSAIPAYLDGLGQPSSSTSAYMFGVGAADSSVSAYLRGPFAADSSTSAYLAGPLSKSSSVSAWLWGDIINRSSVPAWLWADWPDSNDVKDSISAYLEGDGTFPFSDNYTGTDGADWNDLKWDTDKGT